MMDGSAMLDPHEGAIMYFELFTSDSVVMFFDFLNILIKYISNY